MSRQIIAKDIDIKIISKIFEFLAEGHESERSKTFLEIKDLQTEGRFAMYQ